MSTMTCPWHANDMSRLGKCRPWHANDMPSLAKCRHWHVKCRPWHANDMPSLASWHSKNSLLASPLASLPVDSKRG
ncbi:hypothetical protein ACFX19_013833 [Malus domestica]